MTDNTMQTKQHDKHSDKVKIRINKNSNRCIVIDKTLYNIFYPLETLTKPEIRK